MVLAHFEILHSGSGNGQSFSSHSRNATSLVNQGRVGCLDRVIQDWSLPIHMCDLLHCVCAIRAARQNRFIDILCMMRRPGCLELLLHCCPDMGPELHAPGLKGMTSLIFASGAWRHHGTVVFLLRNHEVDADHRDDHGRTAFRTWPETWGSSPTAGWRLC